MTKEEIIAKVKKFQGANREFSQELPPIIDAMLDLIDEAGPEVVDNLESNSSTKALSAKQGKELKIMNDGKLSVPSTEGEAGQILQLNANAKPEWVTPASVGATYDSEADDTSTNAIQNKAIKKYVDDTKAAKDGYYSSLTAGAAENLVGRGSVPASFLRRTTGGTADVGTGSAKIAKLMGNSIVWNQQFYNGNGSDGTTGWQTHANFTLSSVDGKIRVTEGATAPSSGNNLLAQTANVRKPTVVGHKYLLMFDYKVTTSKQAYKMSINFCGVSVDIFPELNSNVRCSRIITAAYPYSTFLTVASSDNTLGEGGYIDFDNIMCIDLTMLLGLGKEPSLVSEFKSLFPLDYYAENAGVALPFAAQKLVTTGFNQFNPATGIAKLLGGNKYQLTGTYTAATIDGVAVTLDAEDCFTPDADCELVITGGNEIDTCVHLVWSGYRNGEFEPYELHEAIFDPANWEDADGNKIFPYGGMHGVGTARDFATPDNDGFIRKGTRVMQEVNLGLLDWTAVSYGEGDERNYFYAGSLPAVAAFKVNVINTICAKYQGAVNKANGSEIVGNKVIAFATSASRLIIRDLDYTDATTFKAALSGVKAYIELATPVEIELAEPVAASYYANDFGVESWEPANDDEPYTAPCEMQIAYAMNAVDTLRRLPENYISTGSFENFCTELATKLGAALNKSITITPSYDAEDQEYDFAINIEDIE